MGLLSQQTKMSCCPGKGMGDWRQQPRWQVSSYERRLTLTLFDMGRGHDAIPNGFFYHRAQTRRRRKPKPGDFQYQPT